jgi:uncharacterized protein YacL
MVRIVIEDAVLYLLSFYLIVAIIFQAGVWNTYLPGQKYDSATNSFVNIDPAIGNSYNILGDTTEINATMQKYNTSMVNPGSMIDPLAIVHSVGIYVGLLTDMIQSSLLSTILKPFVGATWSGILSFILNIMIIIVGIRVLTGRIRWD